MASNIATVVSFACLISMKLIAHITPALFVHLSTVVSFTLFIFLKLSSYIVPNLSVNLIMDKSNTRH